MGIKGKNDKMVVLACEDCKERNYTTTKNKKTNKERMELSKYCPTCKKHTNHKETKQFFQLKIIKLASLVQLVERRSPKPDVEGSSPSGRDFKQR